MKTDITLTREEIRDALVRLAVKKAGMEYPVRFTVNFFIGVMPGYKEPVISLELLENVVALRGIQ